MTRGRKTTGFLIAATALLEVSFAILSGAPEKESNGTAPAGRLFYLDVRGGRVLSANPDGSDLKVMLEAHRTGMDGIVVHPELGRIYWTNMGKVKENDGS